MRHHFLKLVDATYRILGFLPDSDPLKNRAKETVLKILDDFTVILNNQGWISTKNYLSSEEREIMLRVKKNIEILENYLKIGEYQGWISSTNFLIIKKEYDAIKNQVNLPKSYINDALAKNTNQENKVDTKVILKEDGSKDDSSEKTFSRQEKIMDLLSGKGKVQVSDIIKKIPNVTKRTIRRDLDVLLKMGKIVRNGEFNQVFYQKNDRTTG